MYIDIDDIHEYSPDLHDPKINIFVHRNHSFVFPVFSINLFNPIESTILLSSTYMTSCQSVYKLKRSAITRLGLRQPFVLNHPYVENAQTTIIIFTWK